VPPLWGGYLGRTQSREINRCTRTFAHKHPWLVLEVSRRMSSISGSILYPGCISVVSTSVYI
ncbi:hypothetical protein DPEC_G00230180, partial [Dallia pectoralis]